MPASGSSAVEMHTAMVWSHQKSVEGTEATGGGEATTPESRFHFDLRSRRSKARQNGEKREFSNDRKFALQSSSSTFDISLDVLGDDISEVDVSGNQLNTVLHQVPPCARNHLQLYAALILRGRLTWPVQWYLEGSRPLVQSANAHTRYHVNAQSSEARLAPQSHPGARDELKAGAKLEFLDLSYNQLDWTTPDLPRPPTLRSLRSLKELYPAGNPIAERMPEYHIHCLGSCEPALSSWQNEAH